MKVIIYTGLCLFREEIIFKRFGKNLNDIEIYRVFGMFILSILKMKGKVVIEVL